MNRRFLYTKKETKTMFLNSLWKSASRSRAAVPANVSRSASRKRPRARSLRCESLEDRRLLSISAGIDANALHGHDVDSPADSAPPQTHTRTDYIEGVPFQLALDAAPLLAADTAQPAAASSGALHPLNSIPALHSNPGAPASLYLDFDGHFEPVWGAYTNITTPAYDIDGDVTTFNDVELANIQAAWEAVSEDYAPFNIDVTTVEPSVLAPGMPISTANGVALRVAIGAQLGNWLGGGGYAG